MLVLLAVSPHPGLSIPTPSVPTAYAVGYPCIAPAGAERLRVYKYLLLARFGDLSMAADLINIYAKRNKKMSSGDLCGD
jgi:hypothetical protein